MKLALSRYFHVALLCRDSFLCHIIYMCYTLLLGSLLLVRNGLLLTLASTGVVLGALSTEGKTDTMTDAAGIELSVAKRCFVMSKKAGATDRITLTGGCAKNDGLKAAIEKVLKLKVIDLPVDPQLIGALGAAEFARQKATAR